MNYAKLASKAFQAVPFYFLLGSVGFILLFPFYWGFITSLKFEKDIYDFSGNFLIPNNPNLLSYDKLFNVKYFYNWYWNTLSVSALTTLIAVTISVMAGFAIARLRFRGAAIAGTLVFITYLAPRTFLFVPLAQILHGWGLLGSITSLWLTYPTFLIPFCTWLLSGYFANVPREPEECAMVDGASRVSAIVRITLPMAMPGILTAAIFAFTASWNELLYSIAFLSGDQSKMLTNGVVAAFVAGDYYSWGPLMAGATISSLPIAILYFFFTDRFVSGITAGATKG